MGGSASDLVRPFSTLALTFGLGTGVGELPPLASPSSKHVAA